MINEPKHVEFEEDQFLTGKSKYPQYQNPSGTSFSVGGEYTGKTKGIAGWLLRHKIAKSEKSAQFIMLGIIAINFAIMILVMRAFL